MDAMHHQDPETEQPELSDVEMVTGQLKRLGTQASNNISKAFDMTTQQWIRLVVIVGAYMLLRPYVMRFLGGKQMEQMEKRDALEKAKAQISPAELRGERAPQEVEEEDEEEEEAPATGSDWGSKARTRQRVMLKRLVEAAEKQRQEEEDDKDIAEFLTD